MASISLLYFAAVRDIAGTAMATLALPDGATVRELRQSLDALYPSLQAAERGIRFAVNEEFAADSHPLRDGDVVAVIHPVAGG